METESHEFNATDPFFGAALGQVAVRTHTEEKCEGEWCCIHNPSDHPLRDAPMVIRMDKQALVERTCEHGIGHPDPDSLAYFIRETGDAARYDLGIHGCDGCCSTGGLNGQDSQES